MSKRNDAADILLAILFRHSIGDLDLQLHEERLVDTVIQMADEHLLGATLFARLQAADQSQNLPAHAFEYLNAQHELVAAKNRSMLQMLQQANEAFLAQQLDAIVLKGGALLLTNVMPTAGSRLLSDIDLLVPEDQLATARDTLLKLGCAEVAVKIDPFTHRHIYPLVHQASETCFELHRSVVPGFLLTAFPVEDQLSQTVHTPLGQTDIRRPTVNALVLTCILHSAVINREVAGLNLPLRSLFDLYCLTEAAGPNLEPVDWEALNAHLTNAGEREYIARLAAAYQRVSGEPLGNRESTSRARLWTVLAHQALGNQKLALWGQRWQRLVLDPEERHQLSLPARIFRLSSNALRLIQSRRTR